MSRKSSTSDTPPRRSGGIMSSKYATPRANFASLARQSITPTRTIHKSPPSAGGSELPTEKSPSPKANATRSVVLASAEAFFAAAPKPRHALAQRPSPSEVIHNEVASVTNPTRSPYLVLTPDPAPSVSFWVPNFERQPIEAVEPPPAPPKAVQIGNLLESPSYKDVGISTDRDPTPWRPTAQIKDLSTSVLECVFKHLRTKSDQRSLTLASKRGYVLLVRHLYHVIRICLDDYPGNLDVIRRMASPDGNGESLNPGIKHIQRLYFFLNHASVSHEMCELARIFVKALRATPLEWFGWPSSVPIEADILWNLWEPLPLPMETVLSNLQLTENIWSLSKSRGTKDALIRLSQAAGRNLKHIEIAAETEAGLENISALLMKMGRFNGHLNSFTLDLRRFDPPMKSGTVKWDGLVDEPVSAMLFKHLPQPRTLRSPHYTSITKLALKSVNLCHAESTLVRVISLRSLEHLELLHCPFAGRLLDATIRAASIDLQVLKLDHDVDDAELVHDSEPEDPNEISNSLRLFLKSFASCLCVLHIRVKGHTLMSLINDKIYLPSLQSIHFDTADAAPRCLNDQNEEIRNTLLVNSLLQTKFFCGTSKLICNDIAVASAGKAWSNGRQVNDAFLTKATFQQELLKYASPVILTIIMSRWALSMLYDNPTQRLKATGDNAPNETLEGHFVFEIATQTFAVAANSTKRSAWVPGGSRKSTQSNSLEVVIVAVEPDEQAAQSTRHGSVHGLTNSTPNDVNGGTTRDNGTSASYALTRRANRASRYCFVRGHETIDVDGVTMRREVAVPVDIQELTRMGMEVPNYFDSSDC